MRRLFGPTFILAGIYHFVNPKVYESIMPDYLPAHRELVYASGVAEAVGGAALIHPRTPGEPAHGAEPGSLQADPARRAVRAAADPAALHRLGTGRVPRRRLRDSR
jgi:hypothetical protein